MSTAESRAAAPSRPDTLVSFLALYRLLLRTQIQPTVSLPNSMGTVSSVRTPSELM